MTTVLIVDDSVTMREMMATALKTEGIEVIEASNGKEAIEKIKEICPDLVVLDIVMPQMNGYELCRWIKNNVKVNIPVVMCSSKSQEFDRYWGMKQGADAYITKPFHPPEMIKTVKQLLPKHSPKR